MDFKVYNYKLCEKMLQELFIRANFQSLKFKANYFRNKHMPIIKAYERSINIHNSKYEDINRFI